MMQDADDLEVQLTAEVSAASQPEAKWGDGLKGGYQILPNALLRGQHLLELNAVDIVVIANLNQVWWFSERLPYIQPHTIAKRMGVSERSVQRSLRRLRKKRYLRQVRERQEDGTTRYYHDLSGLCRELEQLARRDFRYSEELRTKSEEIKRRARTGRASAAE